MRTLVTDRLTLEPLQAGHAEGMFAGLCDAELHRFLVERPPESVEWLRLRYQRLSRRQSDDGREQWWNWVLRLTHSGEFVGFVQATICESEAEIAYVVFRPYWSRGLASEAVARMIAELRSSGVSAVCACADRANLRSRRLLQRLGFEERPLPDWRREDGVDDCWYVLDGDALQRVAVHEHPALTAEPTRECRTSRPSP
ncbi:Acetyltransferase (GNAT) family protein [Caulifigura coniformis]|uniref:Acetyltransferase (GNAT) family protein n=1 Tax=Caulifigura coniformis TaxID=2527983 RepID=A0A517SDL5_9PLAN|nr:GNAT family N-acetyltransferase [Caulifigura coniformis]QDT54224.1 Acetyltransferase (GNAT) family protein [Caulifigura coniformis]